MKLNDFLTNFLRKVAVVLVVLAMFAVWTIFLAAIIVPTAVYIVAVIPLLWLCRSRFDSNKVILRLSYILFEDSYDLMERVIFWIMGRPKIDDDE